MLPEASPSSHHSVQPMSPCIGNPISPCCYQQQAPISSPAAATTAPPQMHNPHQAARHCNCSNAQCTANNQCNPQGPPYYNNNNYAQYPAGTYQEPKEEPGQCPPNGNQIRQTAYERTLEYVEQCQTWATATQTPSCNMVINDMTSSLNSLMEENRYFQMIQ